MEKVLMNMLKAARQAYSTDKALRDAGYKDTPYWEIYGYISDAIYNLLGEDTETFEQSITYAVLHSDTFNDHQRAMVLAYNYKQNRPALE